MTSFSLHYLLKTLSLHTVLPEVSTLPCELRGEEHTIQSITIPLDSLSFSSKLLGNPPGIGSITGPILPLSFFAFALGFYKFPH